MENKQVNKRKYCTKCTYPASTCLCKWIKPFHSPLNIIILQHPKEALHAKNTVKLLQLGLTNIEIIQGESAQDFVHFSPQVAQNKEQYSLVYPSQHSHAIELDTAQSVKPAIYHKNHNVIFIDASWRKALKMWHLNPWLHDVTSWHFDHPPSSQYKIRQTSVKSGLSTLEAVAYTLELTHKIKCTDLYNLFIQMQNIRFQTRA